VVKETAQDKVVRPLLVVRGERKQRTVVLVGEELERGRVLWWCLQSKLSSAHMDSEYLKGNNLVLALEHDGVRLLE